MRKQIVDELDEKNDEKVVESESENEIENLNIEEITIIQIIKKKKYYTII